MLHMPGEMSTTSAIYGGRRRRCMPGGMGCAYMSRSTYLFAMLAISAKREASPPRLGMNLCVDFSTGARRFENSCKRLNALFYN